jgi:hypothetical protein
MNYYVFKIKFYYGHTTTKVMCGTDVEQAITFLDEYLQDNLKPWVSDGKYLITDINYLNSNDIINMIESSM